MKEKILMLDRLFIMILQSLQKCELNRIRQLGTDCFIGVNSYQFFVVYV